MRWLLSTLFIALGIFAFVNASHRVGMLLAAEVPTPGQLTVTEIVLKDLQSTKFCREDRKGRRLCRWAMLLVAADDREWELKLDPLRARDDSRYSLLQEGDRLRLGLYRDRVYTLERLSAGLRVPGLEAREVLLDDRGLEQWRWQRVWGQLGWLVLEVLLFLLACYLLASLRGDSVPRCVLQLFFMVAVTLLSQGRFGPAPLPEEGELREHSVRYLALGERLVCGASWHAITPCRPERFLLDEQGRSWPLAYQPVVHSMKRGEEVVLGLYDDKVYRISLPPPPVEARTGCAYRQNPMARRTQVLWLCDEDLRPIRRGREPVGESLRELGEPQRFAPLAFRWSERAYFEERAERNRRLVWLYLPLLLAATLLLLTYRRKPVRR